MKRKSKINKVVTLVILQDGTKWIIDKFDEFEVKGWSMFDEIEYETPNIDSELINSKRNKKIKAQVL